MQPTNANNMSNETWDFFYTKWKQNIVKDPNVPQLYSRQTLNVFSILFSVLFGGILLAINLKTVGNKKAILPVLIYSVAYTILAVYIANMVQLDRTIVVLVLNLVGANLLYNYFWGKYIGKTFQYRTKPYWIPAIIGGIISALFIIAIFAGN